MSEDKADRIIEILSINLKLLRYIKRRFIGHIKLYNRNLKVLENAIDKNLNDIIDICKILKDDDYDQEESENVSESNDYKEMYT